MAALSAVPDRYHRCCAALAGRALPPAVLTGQDEGGGWWVGQVDGQQAPHYMPGPSPHSQEHGSTVPRLHLVYCALNSHATKSKLLTHDSSCIPSVLFQVAASVVVEGVQEASQVPSHR